MEVIAYLTGSNLVYTRPGRGMILPSAALSRNSRSAKRRNTVQRQGAEYDSQGQASSAARRVAPGQQGITLKRALKVRNIHRSIPLFQSFRGHYTLSRGDARRCAPHLPLAIIFRAVGAARQSITLAS